MSLKIYNDKKGLDILYGRSAKNWNKNLYFSTG